MHFETNLWELSQCHGHRLRGLCLETGYISTEFLKLGLYIALYFVTTYKGLNREVGPNEILETAFLLDNNKGIHLYLPQYYERNSCHNVKIFLLSSVFSGLDCDSHLKGKSKNLQYVRVRIFSQILDICGVHSIQFFILISKI